MEKKILLDKIFNVLYNSNLVFTKQNLQDEINESLSADRVEIGKVALDRIIKSLLKKGYIYEDEDTLIKDSKLLKSEKNKQCLAFKNIVKDYGDDFDADYIKDEFIKFIKQTELTPALYEDVMSLAFDEIKDSLVEKNKITYNSNRNQIESTLDL